MTKKVYTQMHSGLAYELVNEMCLILNQAKNTNITLVPDREPDGEVSFKVALLFSVKDDNIAGFIKTVIRYLLEKSGIDPDDPDSRNSRIPVEFFLSDGPHALPSEFMLALYDVLDNSLDSMKQSYPEGWLDILMGAKRDTVTVELIEVCQEELKKLAEDEHKALDELVEKENAETEALHKKWSEAQESVKHDFRKKRNEIKEMLSKAENGEIG